MYTRRTKKQRQHWWSIRTDDEKQAFIAKKQAQKAKNRAKDGLESTCPVFSVIDGSNRQEYQDLILRKNPWLDESVFEGKLSF